MMLLFFGWAFGAPLELEQVLESLEERVPQLRVAEQKVRAAEAKLLGKRGAFDPKLKGKAGAYFEDYPRSSAEVALSVETVIGPTVRAGWRVGSGDYPSYDGRKTGAGGEAFAEVEVPVLQGLGLSQSRANLRTALQGVDLAEAERRNKLRLARRKATEAWAKWAAAGEKLKISMEFVEQASSRQRALDRQVEEGSRARMDQLDNLRVLRQREAEAAAAERAHNDAARALSLWHRDGDGLPLVPHLQQLPLHRPLQALPSDANPTVLVARRADVQGAAAALEMARIQRHRSGNALLPDLALIGRATRPQEEGVRAEYYLGAELEVATLLRKQRGARAAAVALVEGAHEEMRGRVDAVGAEIAAARQGLRSTWVQLEAAIEAEGHAEAVAQLERRRFELGGGDVFKLLARESNLMKARKLRVQAVFEYRFAVARLRAAEG